MAALIAATPRAAWSGGGGRAHRSRTQPVSTRPERRRRHAGCRERLVEVGLVDRRRWSAEIVGERVCFTSAVVDSGVILRATSSEPCSSEERAAPSLGMSESWISMLLAVAVASSAGRRRWADAPTSPILVGLGGLCSRAGMTISATTPRAVTAVRTQISRLCKRSLSSRFTIKRTVGSASSSVRELSIQVDQTG